MSHLKPHAARDLAAEADTLALGSAVSRVLRAGLVIYLEGELGAGKTTLARGVLRGLGYSGRVKSPSFAIVEAYEFSSLYLYHFDFYRFEQPQELAEAGLAEYFGEHAVCLVEWPEKARRLPTADLRIRLRVKNGGRTAELYAGTEAGERCLERLQHANGI